MKKELTSGQFLLGCLTLILSIGAGWVSLTNRVTAQETRIEKLENVQEKTEQILNEIRLTLIDVRLLLQNKKDR